MEYLEHMRTLGQGNKRFRSYIGLGYYGTIVPQPIMRNILENPGWYTAYTPYQAEISQGRLEALLNFQTMVSDLTGLPIANASLLDEATAAAEAMLMFDHARPHGQQGNHKFFVDKSLFPQNIDVLRTRATPVGIELVEGDVNSWTPDASFFGMIVQYPAIDGSVNDLREVVKKAKAAGVKVAVCSDLLALTLIVPPGEWGADVCVGNSQRFGVPMGYGGPHAAFFACTDEWKRLIPGRIIGVSQDRRGKRALRMALQTREQHIRRDKATSNICTAQALLAVMAGMYAVYHGPEGLKRIATRVHGFAEQLADGARALGYTVKTNGYFDTVSLEGVDVKKVRQAMEAASINGGYTGTGVTISFDETVREQDVNDVLAALAEASGRKAVTAGTNGASTAIPAASRRTSAFLTHPVFNTHHTETELMRYMKRLENRDFSLVHGMIPLGSCTMKLNAAATLWPITRPEWAYVHPFAPVEQVEGYQRVFEELSDALAKCTGFSGVSLQPNSGAQGEYAGLLVIRAYHEAQGDHHRNVALIPSSAHGTNPASAAMVGMKIVVVKADAEGHVDIADLRAKAEEHKNDLSCLMVTYPSTHGVYEEGITEITGIVHANGGLVYMDGANMNAQVGLVRPADI
ncbi:MAG TPA: aminomethyl-transferring glycine dehydrogenase, partial [Flavobacteriales bacterium]|nr:aminomethyl-transferring glycine dehydrogenase [Flavobacteriales bacterium]